MRIHIDEDMADQTLVRLLQKAGHDVQVPASVGMLGRSDVTQLTHAIRESRVFLTANYKDFEDIHLLLAEAHGNHSGIAVVRREAKPLRNMTPNSIVTALRKLEAAANRVVNEHIVLNHWR